MLLYQALPTNVPECHALPTNVPDNTSLDLAQLFCQSLYCLRNRNTSSIQLRSIVLSILVLFSKPKHFTIFSTLFTRPVDPRIVFETETLHHLFNFTIYLITTSTLNPWTSNTTRSEGLTCFREENNGLDL